MKRSELEAKIKEVFGEEVDSKSVVDYVMAENGRDVNNAKNASNAQLIELTQAKEKAEADLKEYTEGAKKVDTEEFERLKKFEQDTLNDQKTAKMNDAIMKLLEESNASPAVKSLLAKGIDIDTVKLKDDGTIENAEEIIKPLKEAYPSCFTQVKQKGGNPANPPAPIPGQGEGGGNKGDIVDLTGALVEHYTN